MATTNAKHVDDKTEMMQDIKDRLSQSRRLLLGI